MEKVRSLGRFGLDHGRGCFGDGANAADIGPADGNPQPSVGRSPTTGTHEQVFTVFLQQDVVHFTYFAGYFNGFGGIETIWLDIDHVRDIGFYGIAQGVVGQAERFLNLLSR